MQTRSSVRRTIDNDRRETPGFDQSQKVRPDNRDNTRWHISMQTQKDIYELNCIVSKRSPCSPHTYTQYVDASDIYLFYAL